MDQEAIDLAAFDESHLDDAVLLSREAGWPHRREDWAMLLALSEGFVATHGGKVVGTIMMTPFGDDCAAVNMVIVAAAMRGRGLGRRLMEAALRAAGVRECRLTATADGLPLYEKLGFRATHEIRQHRGDLGAAAPTPTPTREASSANLAWAQAEDFAAITALDRAALGMDRAALLGWLAANARFAVLREAGRVAGFGALRLFGRGEVIGPVIAENAAQAQAILSFLIDARSVSFVRVDIAVSSGLSAWLAARGLAEAGGGVVMRKGQSRSEPADPAKPFALVSQALG